MIAREIHSMLLDLAAEASPVPTTLNAAEESSSNMLDETSRQVIFALEHAEARLRCQMVDRGPDSCLYVTPAASSDTNGSQARHQIASPPPAMAASTGTQIAANTQLDSQINLMESTVMTTALLQRDLVGIQSSSCSQHELRLNSLSSPQIASSLVSQLPLSQSSPTDSQITQVETFSALPASSPLEYSTTSLKNDILIFQLPPALRAHTYEYSASGFLEPDSTEALRRLSERGVVVYWPSPLVCRVSHNQALSTAVECAEALNFPILILHIEDPDAKDTCTEVLKYSASKMPNDFPDHLRVGTPRKHIFRLSCASAFQQSCIGLKIPTVLASLPPSEIEAKRTTVKRDYTEDISATVAVFKNLCEHLTSHSGWNFSSPNDTPYAKSVQLIVITDFVSHPQHQAKAFGLGKIFGSPFTLKNGQTLSATVLGIEHGNFVSLINSSKTITSNYTSPSTKRVRLQESDMYSPLDFQVFSTTFDFACDFWWEHNETWLNPVLSVTLAQNSLQMSEWICDETKDCHNASISYSLYDGWGKIRRVIAFYKSLCNINSIPKTVLPSSIDNWGESVVSSLNKIISSLKSFVEQIEISELETLQNFPQVGVPRDLAEALISLNELVGAGGFSTKEILSCIINLTSQNSVNHKCWVLVKHRLMREEYFSYAVKTAVINQILEGKNCPTLQNITSNLARSSLELVLKYINDFPSHLSKSSIFIPNVHMNKPDQILSASTSDALFNALQCGLIHSGIVPSDSLGRYWILCLLRMLPTSEMGLRMAISEVASYSLRDPYLSDYHAVHTCVVLSASLFVSSVDDNILINEVKDIVADVEKHLVNNNLRHKFHEWIGLFTTA